MRKIIIADNQAITSEGLNFIFTRLAPGSPVRHASLKAELTQALAQAPDAVAVIDWIIFSEELSVDFMRQVAGRGMPFGILFKDSSIAEIETALLAALRSERYICKRASEALSPGKNIEAERPLLTATEREILKLIALGKSTKEIAEERFSSVHTITTHRKNIFRKIDVNNVYEATRYALRAGIIDLGDYYI